MIKLYPPVIEGTIPAFYGTTLVVPFSMNRAVSKADISGFSLKIKTVQSNTFVKNLTSYDYTLYEASFEIPDDLLVAGQYYKIQLAYLNTRGQVGYYSTVGVIKYYGEVGPKIYVDGLSAKKSNIFTGSYIGVFRHEDEPMEKVAQYRFTITDSDGTIVDDTDWNVHNTINDVNSLSSNDIYKYSDELELNKSYFLQYKVITSNNMLCSSPKYKILQRNSVGAVLDIELKVENNFENGYVSIQIDGDESILLTGSFEISRRDITNPRHWDPIFIFALQGERPMASIWRDFTVEQGITYEYCIRQFNEANIYSDRIISNQVYADFEHAFLFDGERQLKIKYNPKVSSFKNDILESKTDTIGSKYPFIFRNGHVNYKEFPVSGLISYWSDDEELFMNLEDIGIDDISKLSRAMTITNGKTINHVKYVYHYDEDNTQIIGDTSKHSVADKGNEERILNSYEKNRKYAVENLLSKNYKTTDLVNYNIAAERKFKLEALEWLTNGKPKLFRSPGEGNYIIRLLNTSMTPTDVVGRMIHTFNSTAYEVSEINYNTLAGYGFIKTELEESETQEVYYRSVALKDVIEGNNPLYPLDGEGYVELLRNPYNKNEILKALTIRFDDMSSTDMVYINDEKRMIGGTGVYNLDNGDEIYSVKVRSVANFNEDEYMLDYEQYEKEVANLQSQQEAVQVQIDEQNALLENQQQLINNFIDEDIKISGNAQIDAYDAQIKEQQNIIQDKNIDLEEVNNDFDEISNRINEINEQIELRTLEKTTLEQRISDAQNNNVAREKADTLRAEIEALDLEINSLRLDYAAYKEVLDHDKTDFAADENAEAMIETIDERKLFVSQVQGIKAKAEWAESMKTRLAVFNITWDYRHTFANAHGHYLKEFNGKEALAGKIVTKWKSAIVTKALKTEDDTLKAKNKKLTSLKKAMTDKGYPATRSDCQAIIKECATKDAEYKKDIETKTADYEAATTAADKEKIQAEIQKIIKDREANNLKKETYENFLATSDIITKYDEIDAIIEEIKNINKKIKDITALHEEMIQNMGWPEDESAIFKTISWKYFYKDGTKEFKDAEKKVNMSDKPSNLTINMTALNNAIRDQQTIIENYERFTTIKAREAILESKYKKLQTLTDDRSNKNTLLQNYLQIIDGDRTAVQEWQRTVDLLRAEIEDLVSELEGTSETQGLNTALQEKAEEKSSIESEIAAAEDIIEEVKALRKKYILEVLKKEELEELENEKAKIKLQIKELNYQLSQLLNIEIEEPNKANYINGNTWDNDILNDYEGVFTYSYVDKYSNTFDLITNQTLIDMPCQQFNSSDSSKNILKLFTNDKVELITVLQIQAELKQVENIYLFRDPRSLIIGNDRMTHELTEGTLIDPDVIKDNFSLDNTKTLGEGELPLIENSLYIYHIYPVLSHDLDSYGNHGGVLFGFVEDEETKEGEYVRLVHIAENEQLADWHAPDIMFIKQQEGEYFKIQFFNRDEFEDFSRDYQLYKYNTSTETYEETSTYAYGTQYYTKDLQFAHVTFHRGENYYTDISYYEVIMGEDGQYYVNLFNPYYNFNDDKYNGYFLIYNDEKSKFEITKGYSTKIYINTGYDGDLTAGLDGELYTPAGEKLQPYLDLALTQEFKTELIPDIIDIYVGNGVILNLSYQAREKGYNLEKNVLELKQAKQEWEEAKINFNSFFFTQIDVDEYKYHDENWVCIEENDDVTFNQMVSKLKEAKALLDEKYEAYLNELKKALNNYEAQRSWEKYQEVNGDE